jgi:predicted nucleic acid-binding protein
VARRAARLVFERGPELVVVTTEVTIAEVEEYVPEFAQRYRLEIDDLRRALVNLPLERYSERDYQSHVREARRYLTQRDPDDIPLAALALKLRVPIWSNDKDFRELPIEVYPTAKLLKILGI